MSQFSKRKPKKKNKLRVCLTIDADLYHELKSIAYLNGSTPSAVLELGARRFIRANSY